MVWPANTELVGVTIRLRAQSSIELATEFHPGLHAWFLRQVQRLDPDLSQRLHDEPTEKAFTVSSLQGKMTPSGRGWQLAAGETYDWHITVFSKPVVRWLVKWLKRLTKRLEIDRQGLTIKGWEECLAPTSYQELWERFERSQPGLKQNLCLSFQSPTSFQRQGHHFPLPMPRNVFQSYQRR